MRNKKKLYYYTIAIMTIINMTPYFTWSSFGNSFMEKLPSLALGVCIFLVFMINGGVWRIQRNNIRLFIGLIVYSIYIVSRNTNSISIMINYFISMIIVAFMTIQEDDDIKLEYDYFSRGFILVSLPSILFYVLEMCGIYLTKLQLLPFSNAKSSLGVYYNNYILGIVMHSSVNRMYIRPCGIFDEPGVIGTFAALLIFPYVLGEKKDKVIEGALILIGVFSTSMAFYVLFFIEIILRLVRKKNYKELLWVAVLFFCVYCLMTIETSNSALLFFQGRFNFNTNGWGFSIKNNRVNDEEMELFNNLIKGDIKTLLFGYGTGYINRLNIEAGSFAAIIVEYGFVGILCYFVVLFLLFKRPQWNLYWWSFVIVIIFSAYQRQNIMNWPYLLVFRGLIDEGHKLAEQKKYFTK